MPFLIVLLSITFLFNNSSSAQGNISIRMAAMVQKGDEVQKLKSKDRINSKDRIRLFIKPVNDCHMYLVYSDEKNARYLNHKNRFMRLKSDKIYYFPSEDSFFNFDTTSGLVSFTIICSKARIPDLENLFKNQNVPQTAWRAYEDTLASKLKSKLSDIVDKPFTIAGNVRSLNSEFQGKLQLFSDENIIVRKYELEIKK